MLLEKPKREGIICINLTPLLMRFFLDEMRLAVMYTLVRHTEITYYFSSLRPAALAETSAARAPAKKG